MGVQGRCPLAVLHFSLTARATAAAASPSCLLQGQLRKRDQLIDKLRAQLTRAEAKYRASINALSPGGCWVGVAAEHC